MLPKREKGFTLIELLVVIGILVFLLAMTLVAINPVNQFKSARNTKRSGDVNQILNAIDQYLVVHGSLPTGITTTAKVMTSTAGTGNIDICTDLVDEFIAALPADPQTGTFVDCTDYNTGYTVQKSTGGNNRITINAPDAESATISAVR